MVRVVKEYDERYAEFLDIAQTLFYSKGYEQTSVKEIINTIGVAKGTFYHYFASKVALLDALVERLIAQLITTLEPLVADETLGAIVKFRQFFDQVGTWEVANRDFLLDMMRILYQDKNVLLRTKMQSASVASIAPLLGKIIQQGVDEGVFDTPHSGEAAEILIKLGTGLSEAIVSLVLADEPDEAAVHHIERKMVAYNRSVERMLGAAEGSLHIIDPTDLAIWLPGTAQTQPTNYGEESDGY